MPMLARSAPTLPTGDGWLYEPKLDGFRALVHFDGRRLHIDSRNGKALDSYFPDLVASLPAALGTPCVLDGELVIGHQDGLDFEQLQARLSRGRHGQPMLGASYVAFDLLAWGASLADRPFRKRRALLERHIGQSDVPAITRKPTTAWRRRHGCRLMPLAWRVSWRSEIACRTVKASASWSSCGVCDRSIV